MTIFVTKTCCCNHLSHQNKRAATFALQLHSFVLNINANILQNKPSLPSYVAYAYSNCACLRAERELLNTDYRDYTVFLLTNDQTGKGIIRAVIIHMNNGSNDSVLSIGKVTKTSPPRIITPSAVAPLTVL